MSSTFDFMIVLPAFLAGLLVLATHVPLGAQVLQRGIVFIDLAIAQIAALGVIVAGSIELDPHGWTVQVAAGAAAVLGALLLTWTEKRWPEVQEAQIGVLFVLAATAGLLLLAHNPHGGEHLQDLLAGQILWVSYDQLACRRSGAVLILALLAVFRNRLGAARLLPGVRAGGDGLGAAGRRVPGVRQPDRAEPGRAPLSRGAQTAAWPTWSASAATRPGWCCR